MDEIEKILAIVALIATAFKAFTSGAKDIYDNEARKKEKATLSREEEPSLGKNGRRLTPPSLLTV